MSRYSDEELEVVSLRDKRPWDDRRNENFVRQNLSPTRERSPRRRSPSYERREVRRGSRSPNNRRSKRSGERQLEGGVRHSSSENQMLKKRQTKMKILKNFSKTQPKTQVRKESSMASLLMILQVKVLNCSGRKRSRLKMRVDIKMPSAILQKFMKLVISVSEKL